MVKVSSPKSVVRSNHPPYKEHLVRNDRLIFQREKAKGRKDAENQKRKQNALDMMNLEVRKKAALAKEVKLMEDSNILKERENKVWKKESEKRESQLETNK